ncbi:hypothetical protein D3C78_819120 [compost metagenome]
MISIYALYFLEYIVLNSTNTLDAKHILRVNRAVSQFIAGFNLLPFCYANTRSIGNCIYLGFRFSLNLDFTTVLRLTDFLDNTVKLGNNRLTFRITRLEQLLDTRQTLRNIITGNTAGMERTHSKLSSWLTDRLCRNNTDCFTDLNMFACCQIASVTNLTNAMASTAAKNRANLEFFNASVDDRIRFVRVNQLAAVNNDLASLRVTHGLKRIASFNTVVKILNNLFTILNFADSEAFVCSAVILAYNYILCDIDETASQVTRVSRTKSRIRQTFTRTMRRDKVLEDGESFTEVGLDRELNDTTGRVGHQTTHTAKLCNL